MLAKVGDGAVVRKNLNLIIGEDNALKEMVSFTPICLGILGLQRLPNPAGALRTVMAISDVKGRHPRKGLNKFWMIFPWDTPDTMRDPIRSREIKKRL